MNYAAIRQAQEIPRLAYSVKEISLATSLSVPFLRKEISKGNLKIRQIGSRCLVMADDLREYLDRSKE